MKNTVLANRLADITSMAYSGQSLNIRKLADKYEVSTKTIRRDFERLGAVIERCPETGDYLLVTTARTVFNEQDLVRLIEDSFYVTLLMTKPVTATTFRNSP
jgi:predicted DNA-binding transcriptional regulator YafY